MNKFYVGQRIKHSSKRKGTIICIDNSYIIGVCFDVDIGTTHLLTRNGISYGQEEFKGRYWWTDIDNIKPLEDDDVSKIKHIPYEQGLI